MKRNPHRLLLAAAAAAALLAAGATQAGDGTLSRDAVRAELAQARAAGLLDRNGEAGATEEVLAARERFNATESLVVGARLALEQYRRAQAVDPGMPDLASYVEQGADGPVLVLMIFDADGALHSTDTLALASID